MLTEVDVLLEVNRLPFAQITLVDGSASKQAFIISSKDNFLPGKELEIQLAESVSGSQPLTVFKGIVVRHSIEADLQGSFLMVEAKDALVKLTTERKSAVFANLTDDQVIKQIAEDNGLQVGNLAASKPQHEELVQAYCTDWDFILSRADATGHLVYVEQGALQLVDPTALISGSPQHTFGYGMEEIYSLQFEADGEAPYQTITGEAWDIKNQAPTSAIQAADFKPGPGNIDLAAIAGTVGTGNYALQHHVDLSTDELQAWADAKMRKSRLAALRGRMTVLGKAAIKPLELAALGGLGDRFNGNALITGVRHRINTGGWRTDLQFGLEEDWLTRQSSVPALPAGGLLPAVSGLLVGIVAPHEDDPNKHYRVKVNIPALGASAPPVWARLAQPDAGNGRGILIRPEPGDEVIIGFFNDDPRQAVVLGSMYSESRVPPVDAQKINADNFLKGIYSREKLMIQLDDENKAIQLQTSANQNIELSEKGKHVVIKDINGNTITLDDQGITIKSAKNLILEAAQNVEIKGQQVDVK